VPWCPFFPGLWVRNTDNSIYDRRHLSVHLTLPGLKNADGSFIIHTTAEQKKASRCPWFFSEVLRIHHYLLPPASRFPPQPAVVVARGATGRPTRPAWSGTRCGRGGATRRGGGTPSSSCGDGRRGWRRGDDGATGRTGGEGALLPAGGGRCGGLLGAETAVLIITLFFVVKRLAFSLVLLLLFDKGEGDRPLRTTRACVFCRIDCLFIIL